MKKAFRLLRGNSLQKVSAMTSIKKSTLHHYRRKLRESPGQPLTDLAHGNQVLSKQQETELVQYVIQTQKEGFSLTPKRLKQLTNANAAKKALATSSPQRMAATFTNTDIANLNVRPRASLTSDRTK